MSRLMGWLNRIQLRQALTVFLVGIVFFVSTACGTTLQAKSGTKPGTPEATAYRTDLKGVRPSTDNLSQANQANLLALTTDGAETTDGAPKLPRNREQAAKRAQENAANAGNNAFAKTKQKTGNALDNVREKLNLDEATEGTERAFETLGDRANQAAKGTQRTVQDTAESTQRAVEDTAEGTERVIQDTAKSR